MPNVIAGPVHGHEIAGPGQKRTEADQTGTSAGIVFGTAARWLYVRVYQKTFVAGNGTVGPTYQLQADSAAGFTSADLQGSEVKTCAREARDCVFFIWGLPLIPLARVRVVPTLSGTDTITYDVEYIGIP